MKKISFLFILIFACFCAISCDKQLLEDTRNPANQLDKQSLVLKEKLDIVAQILCNSSDKKSDVQFVKRCVEQSLSYGLDEEIRFVDMLEPTNSKLISNLGNIDTKFSGKFLRAMKQNSLRSLDVDSLYSFLTDGNVQIYWPYSTYWDGIEEPVVTFDPILIQDKIKAYKRITLPSGEYKLDSIFVDEEYSKLHPVWIVNISETEYDNLPDFANNEYSKGNVRYLKPQGYIPMGKAEAMRNNKIFDSTDSIYQIQIGEMQCTGQYDTWVAGGSEFRYKMIGSDQISGIATADYSGDLIAIDYTRDEISKKKWKLYYNAITADWSLNEAQNAFIVFEQDCNNTKESFSGSLKYKDYSCSFDFKYGDTDDHIYSLRWERYAYFGLYSGANDTNAVFQNGYRIYKAGSISWTMPYVQAKKPY